MYVSFFFSLSISLRAAAVAEMAQEFSVWCPAMRLDPCPPSVRRLLTPGREPSPVFSLEPSTSCDPEQVDLGLQPLLGTMVLASQVLLFYQSLVWYQQYTCTPIVHIE